MRSKSVQGKDGNMRCQEEALRRFGKGDRDIGQIPSLGSNGDLAFVLALPSAFVFSCHNDSIDAKICLEVIFLGVIRFRFLGILDTLSVGADLADSRRDKETCPLFHISGILVEYSHLLGMDILDLIRIYSDLNLQMASAVILGVVMKIDIVLDASARVADDENLGVVRSKVASWNRIFFVDVDPDRFGYGGIVATVRGFDLNVAVEARVKELSTDFKVGVAVVLDNDCVGDTIFWLFII